MLILSCPDLVIWLGANYYLNHNNQLDYKYSIPFFTEQTATCLSSVVWFMVLACPGGGVLLRKSLLNINALTWGACKVVSWCHEPGVLAILLKAGLRWILRYARVALPGQLSECKSEKCSEEPPHTVALLPTLWAMPSSTKETTLCVQAASGLEHKRGNSYRLKIVFYSWDFYAEQLVGLFCVKKKTVRCFYKTCDTLVINDTFMVIWSGKHPTPWH